MDSVSIQTITKKDFSRIHHWFLNPVFHFYTNPCLAYPIQADELAAQLSTAYKKVGLSINRQMVGSAVLRTQNDQLELTYLFVAQPFRGNSFAKRLIAALISAEIPRPILAKTLHGQRELERLLTETGFVKIDKVEKHIFEEKTYKFHLWTLI